MFVLFLRQQRRPPLFQLGFVSESWDWWRSSSQFHLRCLEMSHTFAAASSASPIQRTKSKNLSRFCGTTFSLSAFLSVDVCAMHATSYSCFTYPFFSCLHLIFFALAFSPTRIDIAWIIKYMNQLTTTLPSN